MRKIRKRKSFIRNCENFISNSDWWPEIFKVDCRWNQVAQFKLNSNRDYLTNRNYGATLLFSKKVVQRAILSIQRKLSDFKWLYFTFSVYIVRLVNCWCAEKVFKVFLFLQNDSIKIHFENPFRLLLKFVSQTYFETKRVVDLEKV